MADEPQIYDLLLVLSRSASDEQRQKVISDVEGAISANQGSLERRDDWGLRPMAYRIRHETEADYHLIQFSGPPSLLDSLSHSLGIDDTVLRFRIIKVLAGTPPPPDSAPPVVAGVGRGGASASGGGPGGGGPGGGGAAGGGPGGAGADGEANGGR